MPISRLPHVHGRLRLGFETIGECNQTVLITNEQQLGNDCG
jgi:hypothetical protein